jgi:hypothetical protein
MPSGVAILSAVEGIVDEAVIRRLIRYSGGHPGEVYGRNGKNYLRRRIDGFNKAAVRSPWIVLVDLDNEAECAPPLCAAWLPDPAPLMSFRVAVREVEAWLLADRKGIAAFLRVPVTQVPIAPESLPDPKGTMVNLARRSRRKAIRQDMVPRPGSGRPIGPAYTSRLVEFTSIIWRPEWAERNSPSLKKAIRALGRLIAGSDIR